MPLPRLPLALALCLAATLPATAGPRLTALSPSLSVSIDGPDWAGTAERSLQESISGRGNPIVISEYIPDGQSFDAWQELFAIMVEEGIELDFDTYAHQQIGRYLGACDMDAEDVVVFAGEKEAYTLFAIPCGNYTDSPSGGEVVYFFIVRAGPHMVKIYQHARGPAFDGKDMAAWPKGPSEMAGFFGALNGLSIEGR